MKPNPNLPLYDMQSDEVIKRLIQNCELPDLDEYLSYEQILAFEILKIKDEKIENGF